MLLHLVGYTRGEGLDDLILVRRDAAIVGLHRALDLYPEGSTRGYIVVEVCRVQEALGGDAAFVETDAPQRSTLEEDNLKTLI